MAVQKKIELAANIAIIVVAVILGYVLVKQFIFTTPAAAPGPMRQPQVGANITLPDTDFSTNDKTLVLAIKKGCHFCTESAPFYQKLAQLAPEKHLRLIAAFPHSVDEGQGYLKELAVPITEMKQADFTQLNVGGTPTLLLLDNKGQVQKFWGGKVTTEKENEVIGSL
jgi:thiol-disulfide isomerase/thioredoxin